MMINLTFNIFFIILFTIFFVISLNRRDIKQIIINIILIFANIFFALIKIKALF